MQNLISKIGAVVIGRNEGERLQACLLSLQGKVQDIVYVDSGSTDDSVSFGKSIGVHVVELDTSIPFTAARGRNAGFEKLLEISPNLAFVQFVDGDCQIQEGWLEQAANTLMEQPNVVAVCGRRREQFPEQSIYNLLCDIEWDTPVGEAKACGGDSMMRVTAFQAAKGFNPTLIAGEEPELCVRFRQAGGKILRLEAEMTLHDAQMTQFGQWWKRSLRAGHAYAEGAWLHGQSPERHWVKESKSIWIWGLGFPLLAIATTGVTWGFSLICLFALYGVLGYRIQRFMKQQGRPTKAASLYALSCVVAKFPQVQGQLQFHLSRLLKRRATLVEYRQG